MFTDERERALLGQRDSSQSIQTWAWLQAQAHQDQRSLRARLLLALGRGLISLGSRLTGRFGREAEVPLHPMDSKDRVFN